MKLAEAFAKKTYGRGRSIPKLTDETWNEAQEQLHAALEKIIIFSYHGMWEARREEVDQGGADWDDYFSEEDHATNFPAYLEDTIDAGTAQDFLNFRGDAEEIVARIRKRF